MKKLIILFAILLASSAQAQVVGNCYLLMDVDAATASANGSGVAVSTSAPSGAFIATEVATENSGTATLDVKLEHAASCDGTFVALKEVGGAQVTFTQLSASTTFATAKGEAAMLPCVRAVRTITGTGSWDVTVRLCLMD